MYEAAKAINMIAGEDLRGDVFELLTVENDGGVAKVIKASAATDIPVGVLGEEPRTDVSTDGYAVPVVMLQGEISVKAGGNITAGQIVVPSTTAGRAAGVTGLGGLAADQMGFGIALTSAVDGDIVRVLAMPVAAPHSV